MTGSTEFDLSVPATPDSIALVRHAVRAALEDHEAPPAVTADVLLAVSEACTNAVVHAYPDGTAGRLEATVGWVEEELTITVRDRGKGFAPRVDSPGLGLGLPVIGSLARKLEIRTPPGGGTEVAMTFVAAG
jgi:serine/threonine-protein kinase RsbW